MANIKSSGNKPQIDIEKIRYCDTVTDAVTGDVTKTEFLRCFVYKNGVLDEDATKDYELDGVTEYTVQGDVSRCIEEQCLPVKKWLVDTSLLDAGVVERYWEANAFQSNPNLPIAELYTDRDECGLPAHPNGDPDATNILTQPITTDPQTASLNHQSILDFYYIVKNPTEQVRIRTRGNQRVSGYAAVCDGKLSFLDDFEHTTGANGVEFVDLGTLSSGIYKIRVYNSDEGTRGSAELEVSTDNGANFALASADAVFQNYPKAVCTDLLFNKDNGKYYFDDGTELDTDQYCCFSCDPCDNELTVVEPETVIAKDAFVREGAETITFDSTAAVSLTVPAGATYASIQFQGDCATRLRFDGQDAVAGSGKILFPCDFLEIGCSRNFVGTVDDLANLSMIAEDAGCTNIAEVCYFREV